MLDKFNDEIQIITAGVNQSRGPWVTIRLPTREDAGEFMDSSGARYKCFMFRVNDDETLSVDAGEALKEVGEVLYQVEASKPKTFMESLSEVGYCGFVGDENGKGKWVDRPGTARLKEYNEKIEEIKKKLGCKSLSQFAAQVCQSMKYYEFMKKDFSDLQIAPYPSDYMRKHTEVTSRAEYDTDSFAAQRFYDHFQEYKGWANDQAK